MCLKFNTRTVTFVKNGIQKEMGTRKLVQLMNDKTFAEMEVDQLDLDRLG